MNLYLHIGLNKTGSSFIQTVFARNRELLINNEFFFPLDIPHDKNMLEGKITPGNGSNLNLALKEKNEKNLNEVLKSSMREAKNQNCKNVIFSNERLFVTFSDDVSLKLLLSVSKELGFKNIYSLAFLRDPVSHLMSLYKHRSKNGRNTDFDRWMNNDYETVHILNNFLLHYNNYPINWSFRKYYKDSDLMIKSVFRDWLNISNSIIKVDEIVNPSLKLSEIVFLQNVNKQDSYFVKFLYHHLLNLDIKKKADDTNLSSFYRLRALTFFKNHLDLYRKVNKLLPVDEQLSLEINNKTGGEENTKFSVDQIISISKAFVEANKIKSRAFYQISKLKIYLIKLLRTK